jgi:GntR family transcriptional regulator / MocR family aminotransferase
MSTRRLRSAVLLNWIGVDQARDLPFYRQVSDQLRTAILCGRLAPGTYLPASRALALDLGVSRITTLQAYDQLLAEGFLESRRGSGTRVATSLAEKPGVTESATQSLFQTAPVHTEVHLQELYDREPSGVAFQPGIPAYDAFPRLRWARLLQRHALRNDQFILDYAHIGGYAPLRHELAKYFNGSRGVTCTPEQILIVTSTRAAIEVAARILWPAGSIVAVENPGYVVAKRVLNAAGFGLRLVAVDGQGLRVEDFVSSSEGCVGAYVTPAHQWPTGVTLSASRRVALLDWAARRGAWILEDDYDSEFRFDSPPVGTLHSLGSGRVLYIGTFSKTLVPSIRTAYMVVPTDLIDTFMHAVYLHGLEPALHVQAALADFLGDGHFARHVAGMRKLYARRRALLVRALEDAFGDRLRLHCPAGGLQLIAYLPEGVSAPMVSRLAAEVDLVARPMSVYHLSGTAPEALHLGFAAVPEAEIEQKVARFRAAVSKCF